MEDFLKHNSKTYTELQTYTGGAEKFSPPEFMLAKVVSVYDGDTCTVVCRIGDQLCENKVRLLRINTEEIRQPLNEPNRVALKKHALEEKTALENHTLGKVVLLQTGGYDAFGRILSEVWTLSSEHKKIKPELNVNDWMLNHGTKAFHD